MQQPQGGDTSRAIVTWVILVFILVAGALAQFVTAANGIYLSTVWFSPSDLAEVPGQTLGEIHSRGYFSILIASLPVILGVAACIFSRVSGRGWHASLRRAAVVAAGADVLVLVFAVFSSV